MYAILNTVSSTRPEKLDSIRMEVSSFCSLIDTSVHRLCKCVVLQIEEQGGIDALERLQESQSQKVRVTREKRNYEKHDSSRDNSFAYFC